MEKSLLFQHKGTNFIVRYDYKKSIPSIDWESAPEPETRKLVSIHDFNDNENFTELFFRMKGIEEALGVQSTMEEIEEEIWLDDTE